jgi:hypothetical protein
MNGARSASVKCLKRNLVVSSVVKYAIGTSSKCCCGHLQAEAIPQVSLHELNMGGARYPVSCAHIGTSSSGKSSTLLGLCLDASTPFWSNTPLWAWEIIASDSHSNSEIHLRGQRRRRGHAGREGLPVVTGPFPESENLHLTGWSNYFINDHAAACCRSSEQTSTDEFDSVVSRVLA